MALSATPIENGARSQLEDAVDKAVDNVAVSTYGFEADFKKLREIGIAASNEEIGDMKFERYPLKFGKDHRQLRDELVKDLKTYRLPEPQGDEVFVVVTTMKSSEGLKAKEVWRGLSSRIDSEEWEVKKKTHIPRKTEAAQKSPIIGILILVIIGVIILAVLILLLAPQNSQTKEQTSMQSSVTLTSKMELPS